MASRIVIDNNATIEAVLEPHIRADLERRAFLVENSAKRLVSAAGTGRLYDTTFWRDSKGRLRKGRKRVPHRASSPGAPPATDTGRLLNSIAHTIENDLTGLYAKVEARTNYSLYLELGTRYMAPRPFLRPALLAADGNHG